ncbi:MAG TPA: HXXEE domain-containing protein [Spirochaetota bacterium]|nr:HXXEE domain-containing protein [Spirochaetota bacterium]
MILELHDETLFWLLPVFFMIHDFEEIIMIRPWLDRNGDALRARFPAAAAKMISSTGNLSTNAFAALVAVEFIALSAVAFLAAEYRCVHLWSGFLIAFLIHIVMHVAQFVAWRGYVPAVLTCAPAIIYGTVAIDLSAERGFLSSPRVIIFTLVAFALIGFIFSAGARLAKKFDRFA